MISYEPSFSMSVQMKQSVPLPQKSNESASNELQAMNFATVTPMTSTPLQQRERLKSPLEHVNNSSNQTSNPEPPQKQRYTQIYCEQTAESLTQSIDPNDIIPKAEQDETEVADARAPTTRYQDLSEQQQFQSQQQQLHPQHTSHFSSNYTHNILQGSSAPTSVTQSQFVNPQQQQPQPYTVGMINRFRRRGDRMSKDQKELYVKYFEENPCMQTQRRNDTVLEPHWTKLAALLNSVPQGAVKNVEEWKQTFDAWRYRVFMYTRFNSKLSGVAAQNPKNYKPLTPTDQRAYAMWTSHKNTTPQDYEKIDMFANLDDTGHADYDY